MRRELITWTSVLRGAWGSCDVSLLHVNIGMLHMFAASLCDMGEGGEGRRYVFACQCATFYLRENMGSRLIDSTKHFCYLPNSNSFVPSVKIDRHIPFTLTKDNHEPEKSKSIALRFNRGYVSWIIDSLKEGFQLAPSLITYADTVSLTHSRTFSR